MRQLYFLRGLPGCGKSSFIQQAGLAPFVVSTDAMRLALQAPVLNAKGELTIPQNQSLWGVLDTVITGKMRRGELVVIDATHAKQRDWKAYETWCREYRYSMSAVDFSAITPEECMRRNKLREPLKRVSDEVIMRMHEQMSSTPLPDYLNPIKVKPDSLDSAVTEFKGRFAPEVKDFNNYKQVVLIGDLQGCIRQLAATELMRHGPQEDTRYVFVGDICDRGPENGAALKWVLDKFAGKPNVDFLWGNHELHLHRWATDQAPVSKEFEFNTIPQLVESGITKGAVDKWCDSLQDAILYTHGGKTVLVTHSGLPCIPEAGVKYLSTEECSSGIGGYDEDVDKQFTSWVNAGALPSFLQGHDIYQAHGHRNGGLIPIVSPDRERSFNLEGKVEFGGAFRLLTHTPAGFTPIEIENPFIRTMRNDHTPAEEKEVQPAWIKHPSKVHMDPAAIAALRTHSLVKEKKMDDAPHISSFNFTRDAFYDKAWDETNVTARGLFINNVTGEIVARSYDKFFNVGERPETQPEALKTSLEYPVTAYVKENGFLGILGYDSQTSQPFFASKSTSTGPFSDLFKNIYTSTVTPASQSKIKRFLARSESSLIFEVIDPINDPHMVDYDKPKLVLLAAVQRAQEFNALPFPELKKLAGDLGVECKERGMEFKDWPSLERWLKVSQDKSYMHKGKHIEGYVLEDAKGFQTKVKLPYYSHWKYMRSLKDRVATIKETGTGSLKPITDPDALQFVAWASDKSPEYLKQPILTLRKDFNADIAKGTPLADPSDLFKPRKASKKSPSPGPEL